MLNIFIRGFFTFFLNHFFFLSVINKYINLIRRQLDYNSIGERFKQNNTEYIQSNKLSVCTSVENSNAAR